MNREETDMQETKMLYAKVDTFDAGYECDKEKAKKYLELGEVYQITTGDICVGGWQSMVYIVEQDTWFNAVFFKFYTDAECQNEVGLIELYRSNIYKFTEV